MRTLAKCVVVFTLILISVSLKTFAQEKKAASNPPALSPTMPPASKNGIKPYKELITDKAHTDEGLFKVHKVDDKFYLEIPDSLLGRDILVVSRLSRAAAGMRNFIRGYAGD